ncbi:sugar ABC transporter ATP-binding protein [Leucobacter sp. W1153]|uniref:sugar ABC transporter ATP-binding protein n=1 Tax=Leucobacter sp. W1153 TaxID=3439064 RepID=UPI003F39394D
MNRAAQRLVFDRITVDFGATRALHEVSFAAEPGEIIGLLGHNGAGKSTLVNVTTGVIRASGGRFSVDGHEIVEGLTPRASAALGITVIHQEPALAPNMSVLDNLYLGRPAPSRSQQRQAATEALRDVGASLSLDMPVETLSLGERQMVDLARGMLGGEMKVLLLDEPTAALGKAETDALHALIRRFADSGTTVLYVSHRLPDILDVCSRIVVLRGGELAVDGPTSEFTPEKLAEALVPDLRTLAFQESNPGDVRIQIDHESDQLSVRAGEVVGLFGMAGGEQFKLAAELGGAAAGRPRRFRLDGNEVSFASTGAAIRKGVFYVPPDRETEGLIATESARDNVLMPWLVEYGHRGWWVSSRTGADVYAESRAKLDIRGPDGDAEIAQFSGGNRQKHLLARWLYPRTPQALVLSQPTQGVDVGAKLDIVESVRDASAAGAAVFVASSESDEISSMCDRAYVLLNGQAIEVPRSERFNEDLLDALLTLAERDATLLSA